MIELNITKEQIKKAKELYEFNSLKGSITNGESNIYGALGEVVTYDYLMLKGHNVNFKSTYDYDMLVDTYKVDVKTKRTTVKPKDYYFCSISSFNTKQKCDFYFFVRVKEDYSKAYLLGYISKTKFYNQSIFKRKGDLDTNGFKFKDDCYNIEVKQLNSFKL